MFEHNRVSKDKWWYASFERKPEGEVPRKDTENRAQRLGNDCTFHSWLTEFKFFFGEELIGDTDIVF